MSRLNCPESNVSGPAYKRLCVLVRQHEHMDALICMCMYVCICMHIYVYTYMYKERLRDMDELKGARTHYRCIRVCMYVYMYLWLLIGLSVSSDQPVQDFCLSATPALRRKRSSACGGLP